MQVKISQAISMISGFIKVKLVPMIEGSPGTGKSDIVHQIAKHYNLKVIDLRLSQCDPTDCLGFPRIKGDRAGYAPMETFPIEGDTIPEGYEGWLLFLDEFNSAKESVQAAAYKLVLDRMVGNYNLHPRLVIVCAGNKETDNAIVQPMSTALQSRLVHLELIVDHKEWVNWAAEHGIDHRITSYINFKPGNLYSFMPDHTDKTYAAPRTWEFANRVLKVVDLDHPDLLPMLAGTVSEGVAREFVEFCRIYKDLPKISSILASPTLVPVPDEPSICFAIVGAIAHNINKSNIEKLMLYINRLPLEFQVTCLKESIRRNPEIKGHPTIIKWAAATGLEYF